MTSREMAKRRWGRISKKKRSEIMRRLALQRWSKHKHPDTFDGAAELERIIRLQFRPEKKAARVARALAALAQKPAIQADKELWKWAAETDIEDSF